MKYADDEHFVGVIFTAQNPVPERVEACTFTNCDFRDADLRGRRFTECQFQGCDLTNCKVTQSGWQDVRMINCKAIGVLWETCEPFLFALHVKDSRLDMGGWAGCDLSRSTFKDCSMRESDFTGTVAAGTVFELVDLTASRFDGANLEGASLLQTKGLELDPARNRVRGAQVDRDALPGMLLHWGLNFVN